jgi:hypothetical protein
MEVRMPRLSDRISAAWTTVRCPGCDKNVVPSTSPVPGAPTPSANKAAPRWSFIWLQPSGAICPECFFPLARYAKRLKWVQTFITGVALVTLSIVLLIIAMLGGFEGWLRLLLRITSVAGVAALVVGIIGIIVGGRRHEEAVSGGGGQPPPQSP